MAKAKAVAERPPTVEELHFRSESAFLCLLLNRRTKLIRVIDFRAGALPAKRLFIQSIAQREGIEMPICEGIYRLLYEGLPAREVVKALLSRPIKAEFSE